MKDIGLVVEGGGMRGVYTAGVLDFFRRKIYILMIVMQLQRELVMLQVMFLTNW